MTFIFETMSSPPDESTNSTPDSNLHTGLLLGQIKFLHKEVERLEKQLQGCRNSSISAAHQISGQYERLLTDKNSKIEELESKLLKGGEARIALENERIIELENELSNRKFHADSLQHENQVLREKLELAIRPNKEKIKMMEDVATQTDTLSELCEAKRSDRETEGNKESFQMIEEKICSPITSTLQNKLPTTKNVDTGRENKEETDLLNITQEHQKEVDALNNDLHNLREAHIQSVHILEKTKNLLAEESKKTQLALEEGESLRAIVHALQQKLGESSSSQKELFMRLSEQDNNHKKMLSSVVQGENDVHILEAQLHQYEKDIEHLIAQKNATVEQLETVSIENERLRSELDILMAQERQLVFTAKAKEEELRDILDAYRNSVRENEILVETNRLLERETDNLRGLLSSKEEGMKYLREQVQNLHQKEQQLIVDVQSFECESDDLHRRVLENESYIIELENTNDEFQRSLVAKDLVVEELHQNLAALSKEVVVKENELLCLRRHCSSVESELSHFQTSAAHESQKNKQLEDLNARLVARAILTAESQASSATKESPQIDQLENLVQKLRLQVERECRMKILREKEIEKMKKELKEAEDSKSRLQQVIMEQTDALLKNATPSRLNYPLFFCLFLFLCCLLQVNIPPELGTVMKQYTKAVLRDKPTNVYKYSANFFSALCGRAAPFDQEGELAPEYSNYQKRTGDNMETNSGSNVVSEQEAINMIFMQYDDGNGTIPLSALPDVLQDIRETLGLQDGDLPSAEEIAEMLQCNSDIVDLMELRQMLFETFLKDVNLLEKNTKLLRPCNMNNAIEFFFLLNVEIELFYTLSFFLYSFHLGTWIRKLPLTHRQAIYTSIIFVILTATLVALTAVEFSWNKTTAAGRIEIAYPKFASHLGDLITALCLEAQAAVRFVNSATDEELYNAYLIAQTTTDLAYNQSFQFIKENDGMHTWPSQFTLDDSSTIMTAQGVGTITRIRSQLVFNEVVFSAQTTRTKYMDSIKRVISLLGTISQIYHVENDFMGFSRYSAISSAAYAVLQLQKHTMLFNEYVLTSADAALIKAQEKEIIRYIFIYQTLMDLFAIPLLDNQRKYTYKIRSSTTYADNYAIQMFNEVTTGQDLVDTTGVATDSLDEVIKISRNYQSQLPNSSKSTSSKKTHQILLIILLALTATCLILSILDFILLRFYNSKSSRQALHNSRVMHDVLIRVAEYAKEIGTFGLSPPPPPKCMVEERRVGIVEQQLEFLVGSLKAVAPFLPPLLFPYDFKLKADEYSEVKDPGTMVLTNPPRESLESVKLSLEEPHTLTPCFVPMAQKTDIQEQICDVALLYVSLSVFHELNSSEKRNLSSEYYQEIVSVIEECVYQHQGVLTTVAFERAVAVWNIASKSPNFCEQAAACALALSDRLNNLRKDDETKIIRDNFLVHLGVVGGTVNVGIFGNEDKKILSFFGPPVLRGMFVAQTNGYHMTTVACDDYVRAAIQKMYYCKPIELIPEGGCVHEIVQEVSRDDSELELKLATYGKAFEFFERQYHKSALKAFRAYTKQYGYDSSVERIQALIAGYLGDKLYTAFKL
eukprot:gene12055-8307_t